MISRWHRLFIPVLIKWTSISCWKHRYRNKIITITSELNVWRYLLKARSIADNCNYLCFSQWRFWEVGSDCSSSPGNRYIKSMLRYVQYNRTFTTQIIPLNYIWSPMRKKSSFENWDPLHDLIPSEEYWRFTIQVLAYVYQIVLSFTSMAIHPWKKFVFCI